MQTRAIVFDFDGTLTTSKSNSWARIWERLGIPDVDYKYYKMYHDGQIDYNTWLGLCIAEYRDRGVDKFFLTQVASDSHLLEDTKQTLEYLHSMGIDLYILSGGIDYIVSQVIGDMTKLFKHISAQVVTFDGDKILDFVPVTYNPEKKSEYITHMLEISGLDPREVLFVGNGDNDETVHSTGVTTLCLNADTTDPLDKRYWDNHVEGDSLKCILPFVNIDLNKEIR